MLQPPRGAPFVDLLIPEGGAPAAALDELQTRLDLVGGGDWRLVGDDGTMEQGPTPLGPMRGADDRVWAWRQMPWRPGEPLQAGASMAVELAITLQARLAAFGVYGTFAWGLILAEDLHWLHGLVLSDWLYNPRLDERGEMVDEPETPAAEQALLSRKLPVFLQLWTPERAMGFAQMIPPGAVQEVEGYLALALLGPSGDFDPRIWQSFAMQLALTEVRALASRKAGGPRQAAPQPSGFGAGGPRQAAAPPAEAAEPARRAPAEPGDGLTPLARALKEADERARRLAEAPLEEVAPEPEADAVEGGAVSFGDGPRGPLLRLPAARYDAGLLRELRKGSFEGLPRSERPDGATAEAWLQAGAHFVSELSSFSRLFLDNRPLDRARFEAEGEAVSQGTILRCQLPRVAPVLALSPAGAPRRILVCSDPSFGPEELLGSAPAGA